MFGLLDCNNFFVSCERLFRPDLAIHPTVVLSSNDGVVIARSQEVKELGVPMGAPYFKVKDIFTEHNVAIFSGNHRLYRDISKRVMAELAEIVDDVYQYSVDEAFFKIDEKDNEVVRAKLARLKEVIEKNVGVPVSVGAGTTMTIAKFASEKEKRVSGVCVLRGDSWQQLTSEIPLASIWGIGGQTARKMREHGLTTVHDLLQSDPARIKQLFGVHGLRLLSELSEQPTHSPDSRGGFPQSIMSTRSFSQAVIKQADLESAITKHVNDAAAELRSVGGKAKSINIILGTNRHGDWMLQGGREEVVLPESTDDTRVFLQAALGVVDKLFRPGVPYKRAGIVLNRLSQGGVEQLNIFETSEKKSHGEGLMKVLDALNEKMGETVLAVGRIRHGGKFAAHKYRSPEYTTLWSDLPKIKTNN